MGENISATNDQSPEHIARALLDFISLSKWQTITYLLTSLFIVISSRFWWLLDKLSIEGSTIETLRNSWETLDYRFDISGYWTNLSASLIWFIVGGILYLLVWGLVVVIVDGYNDVLITTRFLHPASFHRSEFWAASIGRWLLRFVGMTVFLIILVWVLSQGLESMYVNGYAAWESGAPWIIVVGVLIAMIKPFATLYILSVLLRLAFFRRRVF